MTFMLEHPHVLVKRRELDEMVDDGRILSYGSLRWELETGVSYTFPSHDS